MNASCESSLVAKENRLGSVDGIGTRHYQSIEVFTAPSPQKGLSSSNTPQTPGSSEGASTAK